MENDKEHLIKFKKDIKANNPIHTYYATSGFKTDSKYCRIAIDDPSIISDLMNLGIEFHKTGSKKIPKVDKVDSKYIRDFIRGYFDGNGSIRKNSKRYNEYFKVGINGTKEFLDFIVKELPIKYEKEYYQRHPERNNNNFDIDIGYMQGVYDILNYLYKNANIYLDRKYKRYKEFLEKFGDKCV